VLVPFWVEKGTKPTGHSVLLALYVVLAVAGLCWLAAAVGLQARRRTAAPEGQREMPQRIRLRLARRHLEGSLRDNTVRLRNALQDGSLVDFQRDDAYYFELKDFVAISLPAVVWQEVREAYRRLGEIDRRWRADVDLPDDDGAIEERMRNALPQIDRAIEALNWSRLKVLRTTLAFWGKPKGFARNDVASRS
jgi:hypothetical protein